MCGMARSVTIASTHGVASRCVSASRPFRAAITRAPQALRNVDRTSSESSVSSATISVRPERSGRSIRRITGITLRPPASAVYVRKSFPSPGHPATARPRRSACDTKAPMTNQLARATIDVFRRRGLDCIPTGPGADAHLSFTVPGAVDAYLTLLETYGTKSVSEALIPALQYAERGFPMYEYMHRMLAIPETRAQFALYPPGGDGVFYPGGRAPRVGELFVQPALSGTLRRLVEADAKAGGDRLAGIAAARERFYRGDVASMIGAFSEKWNGLLRASDLAGYRARVEPPLRTTFAGREILGQAAWTQGPVLMQALGMLATLDLRAMGHNSARYVHVVSESLKLAFADRERYYGDVPTVPLAELLAPAYLAERAALIAPDRAMPAAPLSGTPRRAVTQAQADLQIVLNLVVFGMNPQQAVEAQRFATQTLVNSFYPRVYKPGQLNVEAGIPESTRAELRALGHTVTEIGACGVGAVVTRRDPETGVLSAGADPRRPTYALAF